MRGPRALARMAAVTTLVTVGVTVATATSAQAAPTIRLEALAFTPDQVDVTQTGQEVALRFTVRHTDPNVQYPNGSVSIRLSGIDGGFVGQTKKADFAFGQDRYWYGGGTWLSGTPQLSNYEFKFSVPRQANREFATWSVIQFTASDEQGGSRTIGRNGLEQFPGSTLTARSIVDSEPPIFDYARLDPAYGLFRPYVYVGTSNPGYAHYEVRLNDYGSGIWRGSLRLTGPDGARIDTPFEQIVSNGGRNCGYYGSDPHYGPCGVVVHFPPGTAAGQWRVTRVSLTDNAGNTRVVTDRPGAQPVTVTSNAVLSATGFTATPNPVDTWRQGADVTLRMTTTGAQGPIRQVIVDSSIIGGQCTQQGTSFTDEGDGVISVVLHAGQGMRECSIQGLVLVDDAGNVALYGEMYGAPSTGIVIRRVPNTTPPSVTAVTLNPSTVPAEEAAWTYFQLTMHVTEGLAEINGYSAYVYDSNGQVVGQVFGGTGSYEGMVTVGVYVSYGTPPGVYTVGFELHDASNLKCQYGMPGSPEPPGGPVVLTLT